jgi:hypothetical protein
VSSKEDRLLAGKAVFARVVAAEVDGVVKKTREALEARLEAEEGVAAELPDGTRIGTVKRSKGRQTPSVTDARALLAWVREHRPDELVQSVNPAFVQHLKELAKRHGMAVLDDGTVVPGVEMVDGSCSYLPREDPAMVPLVWAKFAELVGHGLLELPDEAAS